MAEEKKLEILQFSGRRNETRLTIFIINIQMEEVKKIIEVFSLLRTMFTTLEK